MKTLWAGVAVLAALSSSAVAETRYDRNIDKAAAEIVAGKIGDIRGGFSFDARPAFVVTPNFYVLKEYNESDLYALFIGHGADRIAYGDSTFSGNWGKVGGLYRSDVASLQRALEAKGYNVGGADGLPGFKTRRSIGDWQAKNGRAATCFPDKDLVEAVR